MPRIHRGAYLAMPFLAVAIANPIHSQPATCKVAVIQVQKAILATREGRQAHADLQSRFDPAMAQLEKQKQEQKDA